ncbi:MAG: hypothetical protein V3R83_00945 [Gammaproteobacteria bacterium]
MRKYLFGLVWVSVLLWHGAPYAHGQKAVEIFIPLGQSPGLSRTVTVIGTIEIVNPKRRTIKIAGPGEGWSAQITDRTEIWLDRSKLRLANRAGSLNDLKQGLMVEVKYQDDAQRGKGPAEWVKVQLTKSGVK